MSATTRVLECCKIDFGLQENARIWSELEQDFLLVKQGGGDWVNIDSTALALIDSLGYEDMASFEASLGGTLEEWVKKTGCVEIKTDQNGKKMMKLKSGIVPEKQQAGKQQGIIMKLPIKDRKDLQIVCSKAKDATLAVPEIGFSTGAEEKTVIDTIYNHIGQAIFKLEYLATESAEPQRREAIIRTTEELRKCLDCDRQWTFVLRDPSGLSEIQKEGVNIENF